VSTETADLTTAKLLFNSVVSTPGARFAAFDIKNFYLNNPMDCYEYMWIPVRDIPPDVMAQYNLASIVRNDRVLVEIRKGMYGLPQAGIIANERLKTHLATWGYHACPSTPGLFCHDTRPVTFCLVIDDFGIKYVGKDHAHHLLECLTQLYTVTTDWSGTKYCGLTLDWDYASHVVNLSMPGYISKALIVFNTPTRLIQNMLLIHGWLPHTGRKHNLPPQPIHLRSVKFSIKRRENNALYVENSVDASTKEVY
jgi:hypothetical protein